MGGFIIDTFSGNILFNNIDREDYPKVINCLKGYSKTFYKKEYLNILKNTLKAAIVLEGAIDLITSDESGRLTLHNRFFKNQSFIFDIKDESMDFIAMTKSKILILNLDSIFLKEKSKCPIRKKIMENIIKIQNNQNHQLNYKIDIYLEKSLRTKIIKYLKQLEHLSNSKQVKIPFTRCELALYLSCDRSALSRELSRMEDDGLLKVNKNKVSLLSI